MAKSRGRKFAEITTPTNGVFDIASVPTITNAKLQNSAMTLAGSSVSLGGTGVADTDALSEGSSNLYFTNARVQSFLGGGTLAGNIVVPDNRSIYLGSNSDFRLVHNTINTQLINATGALQVTSNGGFDVTGAATFSSTITASGAISVDTIQNASGNLNILSTGNILLKFDSDNNQTNRELNIQNNASDQILKITETGTVTFSGNMLIPDGSISSPAIGFANDTDTGILRVTTNALGITAGGSRKFYVNATNAYFQNLSKVQIDSGDFYVDGDVGIGTSSPQDKLHVALDSSTTNAEVEVVRVEATSSGTPLVGFGPFIDFRGDRQAGGPDSYGRIGFEADAMTSTTVDGAFIVQTAEDGTYSERMRISSDGKVGIGTSTLNKVFNMVDPAQGGEEIKLHFEASSGADLWNIYSYDRSNSHYTNMLLGQYLYLKQGGDVGIGTTGPDLGSGWNRVLHLHSLSAGSHMRFTDSNTGATGDSGLFVGQYHNGSYFINRENGAMLFYTNNAERIRILAGGDVGVGTPSVFGATSNRRCFSINGTSSTSLNIGVGGAQKAYIYSDGNMGQVGTVGAIPLKFAPNDNEKARIDSNGNFGIGATSVGARLEVRNNSSNNYSTSIRLSQGYNSVYSQISSNFGGTLTLDAGVGAGSVANIRFVVDGDERAKLKDDGDLMVGPYAYNSASGLRELGSQGRVFADFSANAAGFEVLLLNNRTASGLCSVIQYRTNGSSEGDLRGNGSGLSIVNVSDYRKKKNIRDLTGSLNIIKQLQPRLYEYREEFGKPEGDYVGFIAHEIQEHIPSMVDIEKDAVYTQEDIDAGATEVNVGDPKYQAVAYSNNEMITRLVQAMQEQQAMIEALQAEVKALKGE